MLSHKEPPLRILAMLTRHFRQLWQVKEARALSKDVQVIQKELSLLTDRLQKINESLTEVTNVMRKNINDLLEKGETLEAVEATQRFRLIQSAGTLDAASTADIVIEAVFEDLTLKKTIFGRLDRIVRPGAILATNTSTLDVDAIAALLKPHLVVEIEAYAILPE